MNKQPFEKQATSHVAQVKKLKQRGMVIRDEASAEFYLKHLSYYRMAAYWLPFEKDHSTHQFKSGTHFDSILNLYLFDRELRLLLIDAIERFEVSVRAQWSHHLSLAHGAHAHLNASLARNQESHHKSLERLKEEVERSQEVFIKHFKNKYQEPTPPIWAVTEVMSLGVLSKWYKNLGPMSLRRRIAQTYGVDQAVLQSWLHHLVIVRNLCAHHARIWNREFTFTIQIPRSKPAGLKEEFVRNSRKLYNTLVLLLYSLDILAPGHHWRQRLIGLIEQYSIPVQMMGFPQNWRARVIWKEGQS